MASAPDFYLPTWPESRVLLAQIAGFLARIGRQTLRMMGAWAVLGVAAGINAGLVYGGEWVGFIAQLVAHIVVLPLIGMLLGPFSDRCRDTIVGGLAGLAIGMALDRGVDPAAALQRGMWINKGLDSLIEQGLAPVGGGKVCKVADSVFAGAAGALGLAMSMPSANWERIRDAAPTSSNQEKRQAA